MFILYVFLPSNRYQIWQNDIKMSTFVPDLLFQNSCLIKNKVTVINKNNQSSAVLSLSGKQSRNQTFVSSAAKVAHLLLLIAA